MLQLHDRIEAATRRLAADPPPDLIALLAQRQRQGEHLGYALDRERLVAVAGAVDVPIHRGECDCKFSWIDLRELGDVIGHFTEPGLGEQFLMCKGDLSLQVSHGAAPRCVDPRRAHLLKMPHKSADESRTPRTPTCHDEQDPDA